MGKKNTTINDVAKSVDKVVCKLENLTISLKEGFDGLSISMKAGFERVNKRLAGLERDQKEIIRILDNDVSNNKRVKMKSKHK